jgi:hypothetical protein
MHRQPNTGPKHFETLEHDRYRRLVVRTIASNTLERTGNPMPEDVIMVGEDWIYLAKVKHSPLPPGNPGITQAMSITPISVIGISSPVDVSRIIDDFHPHTREISLIPEGPSRLAEARQAGRPLQEDTDSFRIMRGERTITVYMMIDATQRIDDRDILPGVGTLGWTQLKKPPKT